MRINLFGGPSSGKSTVAPFLLCELKKLHYNIEYAQEKIKLWAYEKRELKGFEGFKIFAKQLEEEDQWLRVGVEHVISDSPLLLGVYYTSIRNSPYQSAVVQATVAYNKIHQAINIFLERDENIPYQSFGRWQSLEEAREVDSGIKKVLWHYIDTFAEFKVTDHAGILGFVKEKLK